MKVKKKIIYLLDKVKGKLPEQDISNVTSLIDNDEFGEAFDILCTQAYEYDISIDNAFLEVATEAAELMGLKNKNWEFIKELID